MSELPILQTIVNRLEECRACESHRQGHCNKAQLPCLRLAESGDCPLGKFRERIRIAVIVTNHNYSRYLRGCFVSIKGQTRPPDEVVIVNDNCSLEESQLAYRLAQEFGVQTATVSFGDVQLARSKGLDITSGAAVLFMDADNELDPDFLSRTERALVEGGPRVAGVYPKIEQRSEDLMTVKNVISRPWDRDRFFRENYIDACSLVWRHALESSWVTRGVGHSCLEDVQMWGQLIRAGWEFLLAPDAVLRYRCHPQSMSQQEHASYWWPRYRPTLTLFLPLSGRDRADEVYWAAKAAIEHAEISDCRLVICNTSRDTAFSDFIRRSAPKLLQQFSDVRIYSQDLQVQPGLADLPRLEHERQVQLAISRIYNKAAQELTTDLVWIVEDDVIVPKHALAAMLGLWNEQTVAVSGAYGSRFNRNGEPVTGRPEFCVAWRVGSGKDLDLVTPQDLDDFTGPSMPIMGAGFGCLLIDVPTFRASGPLAVTPSHPWADPRMFEQVSKRGAVKLATNVRCRHLTQREPVVV